VPALQAEALLPVGGTPQQPFKKGPYPQSAVPKHFLKKVPKKGAQRFKMVF